MENKNFIYRAAATISLILSILITLAIHRGRVQHTAPISFNPPIHPGDPLNWTGYCNWNGLYDNMIVCSSDELFYRNDLNSSRVSSVTMWVPPVQLGDLVDSWGVPTGVWYSAQMCYIYWDKVSVALLCKHLSPYSMVSSISWSLESKAKVKWSGFHDYKRTLGR